MAQVRKCEICGREFIPNSPNQKMCGSEECHKERQKKYAHDNVEMHREATKRYRENNKEYKKLAAAYDKKYQIEHKEQISEYKKIWFQKQQFFKYLEKGVLLKTAYWFSLSLEEKEKILLENKYLKIGTSERLKGKILIEENIMDVSSEIEKLHKEEKERKNTNHFLAKECDTLASEYYTRLNNSNDASEIIACCTKYFDIHDKVVEHYEDEESKDEFIELTKAMDANVASVHFKLGLAYFSLKEYEIAIEAFKCALCYNIKGDESDIYFNIGACYSELKDYFKAYENFKKAYELNKNNTKAQKFANDVLAKLRLE